MSLSNESVNVPKGIAEQSLTTLEAAAHIEESEPAVAPPQKRARRKAAARTRGEGLVALDEHLPETTAREQTRAVGLIRRATTEAMVEANHVNSLKSTGPVTDMGKLNARLNAVKHGITSLFGGLALPQLGESREDLIDLRKQLQECFQPRDSFEMLLVRQMAENRWRQRRVVRAESGLLAAQRLQFELAYEQKLVGEGRSPGALGEARAVAASGLVALPDSAAKFNLILQCLKRRRKRCGGRDLATRV